MGIRATLFRRRMDCFGKFFNRKLLFSLDQLMSRVVDLALFPSNCRTLRYSFLTSALAPLTRRRVAEDRLFVVALFAATRFRPARFFAARPANRFFLVAMLRLLRTDGHTAQLTFNY